MEEQLVSSETAKLAKEKGFNEPTKGFVEPYHHDVLEFIDDICIYIYSGYYPQKDYHKILDNGWFLAPTQSLLQKWIREKHDIHIELRLNMTDCTLNNYFVVLKKIGLKSKTEGGTLTWKSDVLKDYDSFMNSYEDALEIGLQEALKLIKTK